MKKFLIGIVTLAAAAILTSPAFGALEYSWPAPSGGTFYFDVDLATDSEILPNPRATTQPGSDNGFDEVATWGWGITETGAQLKDVGYLEQTTGSVEFNPPVQIVIAQWGVQGEGWNQMAFLFDGYTSRFAWEDLSGAMSHADGYNNVPVPAAVWLLGSGVLGLVAIRRRRS